MAENQTDSLTKILNGLDSTGLHPSTDLLPLLYNELRRLAHSLMAGHGPGNTLQPTALVHEAFLRLEPGLNPGWNSRGHYFAAAAQAMRHILVDQARRKKAVKHGGQMKRVDMEPGVLAIETGNLDILALDQALESLKQINERQVNVVLLRFLAGLNISETALALQVSEATVERDWRFARQFLREFLAETEADEERAPGHGS